MHSDHKTHYRPRHAYQIREICGLQFIEWVSYSNRSWSWKISRPIDDHQPQTATGYAIGGASPPPTSMSIHTVQCCPQALRNHNDAGGLGLSRPRNVFRTTLSIVYGNEVRSPTCGTAAPVRFSCAMAVLLTSYPATHSRNLWWKTDCQVRRAVPPHKSSPTNHHSQSFGFRTDGLHEQIAV